MGVVNSKTFRSGNSEAVRLPKEVAFGADIEVTIERNGDVLTIRPSKAAVTEKQALADFIAKLRALPKPPSIEERDIEELPEPRGL